MDGLSLSVDWYQVEIEKGIDNLTPNFILNECLDGNESQCAQVRRGAAGDLWIGSNVNSSGRVAALNDNLANEEVSGWDIIVDYSLDMGNMGSLSLNNTMSIIDTWDTQELDGAPIDDCKGKWGSICEYPTPDFRNNMRLTWLTPWNITGSLAWRHISEVEDVNENVDLDSIDYFDVAGIWDIFDETASIRLGVNNVLDEEPPIAGGAAGPSNNGNGNVFPGMYDALGRYWYLGVTVGF